MNGVEYDEIQRAAAQLQMSPTMQLVAMLAKDMPLIMEEDTDRKTAFSTCLVDITRAIDDENITFSRDEDRGIVLGLLAVVFTLLVDGDIQLEEVTEQ